MFLKMVTILKVPRYKLFPFNRQFPAGYGVFAMAGNFA